MNRYGNGDLWHGRERTFQHQMDSKENCFAMLLLAYAALRPEILLKAFFPILQLDPVES